MLNEKLPILGHREKFQSGYGKMPMTAKRREGCGRFKCYAVFVKICRKNYIKILKNFA